MSAPLTSHRAAALVLLAALVGCATPSPLLTEANTLLQRGRYPQAKSAIDAARAEGIAAPQLWRLTFRLHLAQGKPAEALAHCQQSGQGICRGLARHELALAAVWWALRHPDRTLRLEAIAVTRALDLAPLYDEMLLRLRDLSPVVRARAGAALSATARGADTLEEQLLSGNAEARAAAVEEIARLAGAGALSVLRRHAADSSSLVRAAVAQGFGRVPTAEAQRMLLGLSRDEDPWVRRHALRSLGQVSPADDAVLARIIAGLEDGQLSVRLAAVEALRMLPPKYALPPLTVAARSADPYLALRAGLALSRWGGDVQPVLNAIARALVDRSTTQRINALLTAGEVEDRVAWRLAQKGLADQDGSVRLVAARTLLARGVAAAQAVRMTADLFDARCSLGPGSAPAADESQLPLCVDAAALLAAHADPAGHAAAALRHWAIAGPSTAIRRAALTAALRARATDNLAADVLGAADDTTRLAAATWILRR